ncbi:MAG: hypothetical protein R6V53_05575 [Candidatus Woesearchaeota archaeon]
MKIEYYPEYICGEKFFLNPETLNGVSLSKNHIDQVSLLTLDKIPKRIPKTPHLEGTMQTPYYHILEGITRKEWDELDEKAFAGDIEGAQATVQKLEALVTDHTPKFYRESNDQYENRQIMVL